MSNECLTIAHSDTFSEVCLFCIVLKFNVPFVSFDFFSHLIIIITARMLAYNEWYLLPSAYADR